jgi:HEAT repeat protein
MLRILLLVVAIGCLGGSGCSGKKPELAETTETRTAPAGTSPELDVAKSAGSSAANAKLTNTPEPPPAQSAASPLRDLTAKYLENDGRGGWRKNELAATELEKLSPEKAAQLWPLLKDPQVEVRRGAAVFLLGLFDPANAEQVAAFAVLVDDSDRMVRARAIDAARQFSRADQVAILPRLAAMLESHREDRADNRTAVARLCGSLKREGAAAIPALQAAATDDPDAKVRSASLVAISQIAETKASAALLAKGLSDKDASVRLVAAARLRQLDAAAAPAVKELAAALSDSNNDVADAAADALIRIGAPAAEALADRLSGGSASARKVALACLAKIGPSAKPALGAIEKCKSDPDSQIRQLAEAAINRIAGK